MSPRNQRIVRHVKALHQAGPNQEMFQNALQDIRDDSILTRKEREAILKTLAQEAAQAYFLFVTGRPIDLSLAQQSSA